MTWTRKEKLKLATMVRLRSVKLQLQAMKMSSNIVEMLENTDRIILEYFEGIGWEVPKPGSWDLLENKAVPVFRNNKTHLFFSTVQGRILKVRKEIAEKALVLGLP